MVKFCKNGSVATTAAVKLARAHTRRNIVVVPYEHPFFSYDDWFIGTTAADAGIPEEIKALTRRFHYNDLASLEAVFADAPGKIACVMLEPVKFDQPVPGFLEGVRALCDAHGALLVLDETVSGLKWRMRGGGEYFGITADLSVWGKGLANGFSACALSGRRDVMALGGSMERGERVFLVSTTHGAESSALAAMLKTLEIFERDDVIATNWRRGAALKARLQAAVAAAGLDGQISILGYPCLLLVTWAGQPEARALEWKTLLFQELVREGILFQGVMYPTASHDEQVCEETVAAFQRALPRVAEAWKSGSVEGYLEGPAIRPVFRKFQECVKGRCGRVHADEPKEACCRS
jgi:glutamate-1-semialdehyde 2,1-aminomutase